MFVPFASALQLFWIHSPLSTIEGRFLCFQFFFCHCFASAYLPIFSGLSRGQKKIVCSFWSLLLFLTNLFPWEGRNFWKIKNMYMWWKGITFCSRSSPCPPEFLGICSFVLLINCYFLIYLNWPTGNYGNPGEAAGQCTFKNVKNFNQRKKK